MRVTRCQPERHAARGPFLGVAPTGKKAMVTGMAIYRLAGGKCVERWVELRLRGLLQELGAVHAFGAA